MDIKLPFWELVAKVIAVPEVVAHEARGLAEDIVDDLAKVLAGGTPRNIELLQKMELSEFPLAYSCSFD
ncbi:MAG TPA: hypothetical protein VJJ82_00220 [Candidatus Nanoarchaeia archaeon]|nr:hypothetical protein [Candidatus Nanoarchaeia archaeon]